MDLRVDRSETAAVTPERLLEAVIESVAHRTNGQIRDLAVSISNGVAKLTGKTSRYYYKQLATSGVLDGEFELDVENEISVGIR
ncbi:MAG: hypothetical protein O3B13_17765 [Planctomycetota bacterium]|nr:hypothetical protein [Planctomycetota bacterium]MDA1164946.1 hypothetical protein [Planctomycetota bacterium]